MAESKTCIVSNEADVADVSIALREMTAAGANREGLVAALNC